jgi:hypothetical protein
MPRLASILRWILLTLGLTVASILLPAANFSRSMPPSQATYYLEGGNTPLAWFIPPPQGVSKPYGSNSLSSLGYSETILTTAGLHSTSGGDSGPWPYTQWRTSVGFPFTALRHIEQEGMDIRTIISQYPLLGFTITLTPDFITISSTAPRGTLLNSALRLPRSIFLPGLIANCIFWCGTLVLCSRLLHHLRQSRRVKKGLCVRCGFDLARLPRCPECGTAATPPATNAPECPAPPPS